MAYLIGLARQKVKDKNQTLTSVAWLLIPFLLFSAWVQLDKLGNLVSPSMKPLGSSASAGVLMGSKHCSSIKLLIPPIDIQCVLLHLHGFRRHISFSVTQIRLQVTVAFVHFKEVKCCQLPVQVWLQLNEIRCLFCQISIKLI